MNIYYYNGPVLEFDKCIANNWSGSTRAPSEKKARCNLAYQFKMKTGRVARTNITIPGKLKIVESEETTNG